VAATPRTGSTLLCEALEATSLAGRPAEIFAPHLRAWWRRHFSLSPDGSFAEYFRTAVEASTTDNGVYGIKVMSMHLAELAGEVSFSGEPTDVLTSLFPDAAYVNVVRRDRRAQALSLHRAHQTDEWFRRTDNPQTPLDQLRFDVAAVTSLETDLEVQQRTWDRYFERRRINPLLVEYETLIDNYRGEVARVLSFVGLEPSHASAIPSPSLKRQSDELTISWRRAMDAGTLT
jgi:LPS sulfotransferase NodH